MPRGPTKLAQTDPNWFVGAQATWTLFDGGARRARIAARASETAKARIERQHAAEQVELAVRSAWLEHRSQTAAWAAALKSAELARESLNLATKRFAAGAGTRRLCSLPAVPGPASSPSFPRICPHGPDAQWS